MSARTHSRHGQAIVLLLGILVVFVGFIVWIIDIRGSVLTRLRTQDAGDAVGLEAARWQAAGLNLIGELNLMQAYLLSLDPYASGVAENLHLLRQRLQITTPFLALAGANLLAERNGLTEMEDAKELLHTYAACLRPDGLYPGAEEEQRALLERMAEEPLFVYPLAPIYESSSSFTYLIVQDFYEAIMGRNWCWFWFHAYAFLQNYQRYSDFGPVPELSTDPFFSLHLDEKRATLDDLLTNDPTLWATFNQQLTELGHPTLPEPTETTTQDALIPPPEVPWTIFDASAWGEWTRLSELPIEGSIREAYNVDGANVALAVTYDDTVWVATARPFGTLGGGKITAGELVLGGFSDVRLIPVDAADAGSFAGYDIEWVRHLSGHIQTYAQSGITSSTACRYCAALRTWDLRSFRNQALNWLRLYGDTCNEGSAQDTESRLNYGH